MDEVCLVLLIPLFVIVLVFALILGPAAIAAARRKSFVGKTTEEKSAQYPSGQWFPVRYATEKRFRSWLKFVPWQAYGVLYAYRDRLIFFAHKLPREHEGKTEMDFDLRQSRLVWEGADIIKNGVIFWFSVETPQCKHYFTCETGMLVFGSEKGTRNIFDELTRISPPTDPGQQ